MRMTALRIVLMTLATATLSQAYAGQDRGGGQIVDVGKTPVLRDFVDRTNCEWVPAEELMAELKHFPAVLDAIRPAHWYFAKLVESEVKNLIVCETQGRLVNVPTEDIDGVGVINMPNAKPVAVRINNSIFLDRELFDSLDHVNKAYVFFHEIMHSFISWKEEIRNTKLRSFVSTVRKQEITPVTVAKFRLQMRYNGLTVPDQSVVLSFDPSVLAAVSNTLLPLEARAEAARKLCPGPLMMSSLTSNETAGCVGTLGQTSYGETIHAAEATALIASYSQVIANRVLKALLSDDVYTVESLLQDSGMVPDFLLPVGTSVTRFAALNKWVDTNFEQKAGLLSFPLTPILIAITNGSVAMVRALLAIDPTQANQSFTFYGTFVRAKKEYFMWVGTPRKLAKELGYLDIVAAIEQSAEENDVTANVDAR